MNKTEYVHLYRQARKSFPHLTKSTMTEVLNVYKKAGNLVAEQLRKAELAGASILTTESLDAVNRQLGAGSALIRNVLDDKVPATALTGVGRISAINVRYMRDAITESLVSQRITGEGVSAIYRAIDERVVRSVVNRIYQDGYNFTDRVWRIGESYQSQMKDVISTGFAQGRDPVKIAKDLQVYIADGKRALASRYGPDLTRPAKNFMKRIGNKVDWRALRIVRSELYASLQEAGVEQGRANPGTTGYYDWVLEAGRQHWNCGCPDNQAGSPYLYTEVPAYPHPNCRCMVRPILRDHDEFINDLQRFASGEPVRYLNEWDNEFYAPVA